MRVLQTCAPARAHACARAGAPPSDLRAGNAAAIPRQSHQKLIKKVRCGCPYVLESDPMLPTTLILTIFRSSTLSVMCNLHKPEFPRVRLPTQGYRNWGLFFPPRMTLTQRMLPVSHIPGAKNAPNLSYPQGRFSVLGAQKIHESRPVFGSQHTKIRQKINESRLDPGIRRPRAPELT